MAFVLAVCYFERDIQEPNLEQMRRICVILKLDPRYLLDITETDMITDKDLRLLKDARELIEKYR